VAILLRFDAVRATINPKGAEYLSFPKPFFYGNIIAYAFGLFVTVFVMYYFQAAQPALLYLVPACLGASLIVSYSLGAFNELCAYDEDTKKVETNSESKKTE